MNDLSGDLEKWLQQVQRYQNRKDSSGNRKNIDDDILVASLCKLVPERIRSHIDTNGYRLADFEQTLTEVKQLIELHVGKRITDSRVTSHRSGDQMDVDALDPKGKGKGRGHGSNNVGKVGKGSGSFQGCCNFCGAGVRTA